MVQKITTTSHSAFLHLTDGMLTDISCNLSYGHVCLFVQSRIHVWGSREIVSLVSQFLPTFQCRPLTGWSLRSFYQSLISQKLYTAWDFNLEVLRSMLLTAINYNPLFISIWHKLSHEATVQLQTGLLDNRIVLWVQEHVCIIIYVLLHICMWAPDTGYSNHCFSSFLITKIPSFFFF